MSLSQNFRTEVNLQSKSKNQNHSDKFLLIGSCFATEMSLFLKNIVLVIKIPTEQFTIQYL